MSFRDPERSLAFREKKIENVYFTVGETESEDKDVP